MSQSPIVGDALANAVASRLESGHILADSHPEYCGVGLACQGGIFVYAEVNDGQIATEAEYQRNSARGDRMEFHSFASRAYFVAWLSVQSDGSLSGRHLADASLHGNQRLTLKRLQDFAA